VFCELQRYTLADLLAPASKILQNFSILRSDWFEPSGGACALASRSYYVVNCQTDLLTAKNSRTCLVKCRH